MRSPSRLCIPRRKIVQLEQDVYMPLIYPIHTLDWHYNSIKNKYQNEHTTCTHTRTHVQGRAHACNACRTTRCAFRPHIPHFTHIPSPSPGPQFLWHMFGHSGVMLICILYTDYNMNTRIAITMINRLRPIGKCSGLMTKDSNWRRAPGA